MSEDSREDDEGAYREKPDPEELERRVDNAVNASGHYQGSGERELRAQILQTQQLIYDLDRLHGSIEDLNESLVTFTWWQRVLTVVLIGIGLLQLFVLAIQVF